MSSTAVHKLPKVLMLHGSIQLSTNIACQEALLLDALEENGHKTDSRIYAVLFPAQNASIFSKRLAAVRKACQGHCEMVFVDAPLVIEVPDPTNNSLSQFDSAAVANHTPETDPALIPRAWWRSKEIEDGENGTRKIYEGFDESMQFIRRVIDDQGPFDACFGFSQGAALAGIISSILEHPSLHTAFSVPPLTAQKPFKAAILVSGFQLHHPPVWHSNSDGTHTKLNTRSLHVIGKTDVIVGEDRSQSLVDVFTNPRVERHDGGHFVPSKKNWRDFFALYMQSLDQADESLVLSPGQVGNTIDGGAKF
ncbi:hypothetical protein PtA15_4A60 [Puccinia triticina]|uniref:Serine hydrolase domain-containing protein n=1 Tax=Puccinia triticina TaxID=208348 RepID=A0ABY7CI48_9BASI|nr:uncharacterized protein PtA15_4A60 [Puccinia triticina]WAQ83612.1 hypothetical protein PtA15_4A60 [Puccinia triticina]